MTMKLSAFFQRSSLARALWAFRDEFRMVALFSLVANLLMLTPTFYMLQVYDRALVSQSGMTLIAVSLLALFLFVTMSCAELMRSKLLIRAGLRFDEMLNSRVFNASFASFLNRSERNPSEAFADLINIRQFLTGNGLFAVFDAPWTPIYILATALLHPWLGLLALLFAFISGSIAWLGHRVTRDSAGSALDLQQKQGAFVQERLRSAEVIESMGMFDALRQQWLRLRLQSWSAQATATALSNRIQSISKFVRYTQQSLMLAAGAVLVIRGEMSPGGMIAANLLMARALAPVEMLVSNWTSFIAAGLSFRRLEQLLDQHPEPVGGAVPVQPRGEIRLAQLVAKAAGREAPILQQLTTHFPAGKVTLIMGPSGSGKSTLVRCLLGIWPEVEGEVMLDGVPIAHWDRTELGRHVGYLPQDVELLEGTVAENIARFGEVQADKVIEAAQQAGVHDMILRLPKGYDTPLGAWGNLLSAGQRQRIALARALYRNPCLVVLDEPNANLDDAGEAALASALRGLRARGQTVFLISHRMLALDAIDWVVMLQAGRIRLQGTRDEVIGHLQRRPAQTPVIAQIHSQLT
jgi:ATP-binding cassette subfamily C exporter for protease/lipase